MTNHDFQWVGIDTTSIQKVLDIYRGLSKKSSISRDFYLKHAKRKEVEYHSGKKEAMQLMK